VDVVMCDLTGPISKTTSRRFGKIDEIWNIASESHVDRSIDDPVQFVQNNVSLMLHLLEYAKTVRPTMFLQMSTDEVYGPAEPGYHHVEWDTIAPSNPYSASKAAQEAICFSYWRTYEVPVIITNTMNIIGELQDSEKFVPLIIKKLLSDEEVPIHVGDDNVSGSRYYLHARNLADAWVYISNHHVPQRFKSGYDKPSRFHIVGEREVSNEEMVHLVADILGVEPKIRKVKFHNSRPGHDLRYALDGEKIKDLGWRAPVSFDNSLGKTVRWYLKHPEWLL
jgi:dTDP-glucose 4,6-dehydratase